MTAHALALITIVRVARNMMQRNSMKGYSIVRERFRRRDSVIEEGPWRLFGANHGGKGRFYCMGCFVAPKQWTILLLRLLLVTKSSLRWIGAWNSLRNILSFRCSRAPVVMAGRKLWIRTVRLLVEFWATFEGRPSAWRSRTHIRYGFGNRIYMHWIRY